MTKRFDETVSDILNEGGYKGYSLSSERESDGDRYFYTYEIKRPDGKRVHMAISSTNSRVDNELFKLYIDAGMPAHGDGKNIYKHINWDKEKLKDLIKKQKQGKDKDIIYQK